MNIKDLLKDAYKEDMTLEEIETALADIELPVDRSAEIKRLNEALSKSNSENAEWKRKHREAMSEEERKAQETADLLKQLQDRNAELERESNMAKHKAKFLSMGYAEDLAGDAATAMVDGDTDKLFEYQLAHQEALAKQIRTESLKGAPKPVPDGGKSTVTREQIAKMSVGDRLKFYQDHPEEYKELYGGN